MNTWTIPQLEQKGSFGMETKALSSSMATQTGYQYKANISKQTALTSYTSWELSDVLCVEQSYMLVPQCGDLYQGYTSRGIIEDRFNRKKTTSSQQDDAPFNQLRNFCKEECYWSPPVHVREQRGRRRVVSRSKDKGNKEVHLNSNNFYITSTSTVFV